MKKYALTIIVLFLFVFNSFNYGQTTKLSHEKYAKAVANLLVGINSQNSGLRASCAFLLGELEAKETVYDLLKLLKNDSTEEARLMAGLSLIKIGTEDAVQAIRENARFNSNDKVKEVCSKFYQAYLTNQVNKGKESLIIKYATLL